MSDTTASPADAATQAKAARETVLAVPVTDRAAILATGKDASRWLNGLVTCDLAKRAPGEAAYGLLVEKKGRIQVDLYIAPSRTANDAPALALAVPAGRRDEVLSVLDHHLIMEDVELAPAELVFVAAHGPRAAELASLAEYGGTLDLLGSGGAVLAVPSERRAPFEEALAREVAVRGGALGDDAGWEAVRIEAGLPRFGVEVDGTLYPQEASLEKVAVSFSKGCYLGQEVVYMLENRGHVKRKLVPLAVEGDGALAAGDPVTSSEGDIVGEVKSSVVGPTSGRVVAIAMVKWALAKPGTELCASGRVARVR